MVALGLWLYGHACRRSSHLFALEEVRDRIELLAASFSEGSGKVTVHRPDPYPGWAPDSSSPLLALTLNAITAVLKQPAQVCGVSDSFVLY